MDLHTFLRLAKRYSDMGWSIQEQLVDVAGGQSMFEQNTNALSIIAKFLHDAGDDLDGGEEMAEEIERFLESESEESE
jgi:hypothetical protein